MRLRSIVPFALAGAIAALAAACGGAATPTPTTLATPTSAPEPTSTVAPTPTQAEAPASPGEVASDIRDFKLQTLTVQVGESVTWTNRDGAPHTTTAGEPGAITGVWGAGFLIGGGDRDLARCLAARQKNDPSERCNSEAGSCGRAPIRAHSLIVPPRS